MRFTEISLNPPIIKRKYCYTAVFCWCKSHTEIISRYLWNFIRTDDSDTIEYNSSLHKTKSSMLFSRKFVQIWANEFNDFMNELYWKNQSLRGLRREHLIGRRDKSTQLLREREDNPRVNNIRLRYISSKYIFSM